MTPPRVASAAAVKTLHAMRRRTVINGSRGGAVPQPFVECVKAILAALSRN
jgi:hypothetical protein